MSGYIETFPKYKHKIPWQYTSLNSNHPIVMIPKESNLDGIFKRNNSKQKLNTSKILKKDIMHTATKTRKCTCTIEEIMKNNSRDKKRTS